MARRKRANYQRFTLRSSDQQLFEQVQHQMRDPVFAEVTSERMWKIERLFAEAKQEHRASRAKFADAQRADSSLPQRDGEQPKAPRPTHSPDCDFQPFESSRRDND